MKWIKSKSLRLLFVVFFFVTLILPLFNMFATITTESIQNLLFTPVFGEVILRSVLVTATATLIAILLALALSWCVAKTAMPFKNILIPALTLPMLIPSISHGMGLVILFGAKGIVTNLLHTNFNLYGFSGIVIGSVLYTFPIAFLMLMDVFKYEDDALYEAAQVMGVSKLRQFTDLTLVYLKKPLISAFFAVFTMIFTDYGVPLAVGGKYRVLSTYMYREVLGLLNFSNGAVVGIILLLPAILAFIIDFFSQDSQSGSNSVRLKIKASPVRDRCAAGFCILTAVLFNLPIIAFVVLSVVKKYPVDLSLSFDSILQTLQLGAGEYFFNAIVMSLLTALVGTAIAFTVAYFTSRGKQTFTSRCLHLISLVTVAVPGIVLGLGYVTRFSGSILYGTLMILVLVNTIHFFSSPYLMAHNALLKLNPNFEDIAMTLNIPKHRMIRDVLLPSTFGTLLEMFTYYFINGMITISAISFLSTVDNMPLALMIPVFEGQRLFECAAFVSLIILVSNLILKALISFVSSKWQKYLN